MFHLLGQIHKLSPFILACSGGVDSMVARDFLLNGGHRFSLAYFNHGTEHGEAAERFIREVAAADNQPLVIGRISSPKPPSKSPEGHWRDERYAFLESLGRPVLTAHHLGDAVETWLFTALHGEPRLIPYRRGVVYRPFLLTSKREILEWAERKRVRWIEDPSNHELVHARNRIRHRIVPEALAINPGLAKVVARKLRTQHAQETRTS